MELIYCDLRLDLSDNRTLQTVRLKQYDDGGGKRIHITLYNNGEPVTLDDNTEVSLYASVGKTILAAGSTNNCGVDTAATGYDYGYIYINVTEELTSIAGTVKCDVRITTSSTEHRVHTATFYLDVEPSAVTADMTTAASTSNIFDVIESNVESAAESAASEIQGSLSKYILWAVSSMFPEYTCTVFSEEVESGDESGVAYRLDLGVYDPDNDDGIIILVDGVMLDPSAYTTRVSSDGNLSLVVISSDAGLEVGQTVTTYYYHKPESTATATYGTTTATTSGTTESADGTATATTTGTTVSVYGVAEEVTDEDTTE